jgi:hypothetical protein
LAVTIYYANFRITIMDRMIVQVLQMNETILMFQSISLMITVLAASVAARVEAFVAKITGLLSAWVTDESTSEGVKTSYKAF